MPDPSPPSNGHLYLIPTPLGKQPSNQVLPDYVVQTVHGLDTFFVERIRQANSFLRWIKHPIPDYRCRFYELNKHTPYTEMIEMLALLKQGTQAGIISEAGCPAIADPGSELVRLAHHSAIPVTPLVGPSSILLAVMASGLNGQAFSFHGYLPKPGPERTEAILRLQNMSARNSSTQVFMETPFRNNDLLAELLKELDQDTFLSIASNLTLEDEQIITRRVSEWHMHPPDLTHKPSIFLILSDQSEHKSASSTRKSKAIKSQSRSKEMQPGVSPKKKQHKKKPARKKRRAE